MVRRREIPCGHRLRSLHTFRARGISWHGRWKEKSDGEAKKRRWVSQENQYFYSRLRRLKNGKVCKSPATPSLIFLPLMQHRL
jgi:hypothetical protein